MSRPFSHNTFDIAVGQFICWICWCALMSLDSYSILLASSLCWPFMSIVDGFCLCISTRYVMQHCCSPCVHKSALHWWWAWHPAAAVVSYMTHRDIKFFLRFSTMSCRLMKKPHSTLWPGHVRQSAASLRQHSFSKNAHPFICITRNESNPSLSGEIANSLLLIATISSVFVACTQTLKGVSSLTSIHYLWRSLGPFSQPCAQKWP